MGQSLQSNIRSVTRGITPRGLSSNAPYSGGLQKQFYERGTKAYYSTKAYIGSAFFEGEMQGVDYDDFFNWMPVLIRTSNVIDPTTGKELSDDWQAIMVQNPDIDTIPIGAMVKYNQSIWLSINPSNIGSMIGASILRRCNAFYRAYDFYGNIIKTPFVWAGINALATANITTQYMINVNDYQICFLQLNSYTDEIRHNNRMVFNHLAYSVTGVNNFLEEYSDGDKPDQHFLSFVLRRCEPQPTDDLENSITGGKLFSWEILLSGSSEIQRGSIQQLIARSIRNGEEVSTVPGNEEGIYERVEYIWESSDEDIASVSESGLFSANLAGEVDIVCRLARNPEIFASFNVRVVEMVIVETADLVVEEDMTLTADEETPDSIIYDTLEIEVGTAGLVWIETTDDPKSKLLLEGAELIQEANLSDTPNNFLVFSEAPSRLRQFTTARIAAAYYSDGCETDEIVTYLFDGPKDAFTAEVDGNIAVITCRFPSAQPLIVTISHDDYSQSVSIILEGY